MWQWPMVGMILLLGLVLPGRMRRLRTDEADQTAALAPRSLTPRRALLTGLAGSVGVGNISGVACALTAGGPGAIFWMWVCGLLGMGTAYAEAWFAARYPGKGAAGYIRAAGFAGGAKLFCGGCVLAALGMGGMAQANAAGDALAVLGMPRWGAVVLLGGAALVLAGKELSSAGKIAEGLVPAMGVLFLLLCGLVLWQGRERILPALCAIPSAALGFKPCIGGVAGATVAAALRHGVARGVFTNEAGLGTAPFAYGSCGGEAPRTLGRLAALQVALDTLVLCTLTAVCLLITGWQPGTDGAALCFSAFGRALGPLGEQLLAVCTLLFALAAMVAWSAYGRAALEELLPGGGGWFCFLFAAAAAVGAQLAPAGVLLLCDAGNLCMALPNGLALLWLTKGKNSFKWKNLFPKIANTSSTTAKNMVKYN